MSDKTTEPNPLFVKNEEAKKGHLWHKLSSQRFHKQHGDGEIPEGDRHAVAKYHSPIHEKTLSPEETQAALNNLETQIKVLQEKEKPPVIPEKVQVNNPEDDWYD